MRKWHAERKIDCYGKNMAIKVSGVAICDFVPSIKRKVQKMFCPTQCFCLLFLFFLDRSFKSTELEYISLPFV